MNARLHNDEPDAVMAEDPDEELAVLMERSTRALARAGITVQDLLDALPAARAAVLEEAYGTAYMQEIDRMIAALRQQEPAERPMAHGQ